MMMTNQTSSSSSKQTRMHFTDPNFHHHMLTHIRSYFPQGTREIVIVCIGTDRCTGDALGPLVGTYLKEFRPRNFSIYGTIHSPVHATNITDTLKKIHATHHRPLIIAIDASLGKSTSVGSVLTGTGSLQPGSALKKKLPTVGHIYIAGIVNISGFMEFAVLQNTRLSIVIDMADKIARLLYTLDLYLTASQHQEKKLLS